MRKPDGPDIELEEYQSNDKLFESGRNKIFDSATIDYETKKKAREPRV